MQSIVSETFTNIPFKYIYKINNIALLNMDKITLHISYILFLHNIKENSLFYFYKIISAMGGIPFFLFFCILLFIAFVRQRQIDVDLAKLFVFLILLIIFFNAMLVAVAEENCTRYFCYTQFLLYCFGGYVAELIYSRCA